MLHECTESWRPRKIYCCNCRTLVSGIENNEGITKMTCPKCGTVSVLKRMGRRHDRIEVYPPKGSERLC